MPRLYVVLLIYQHVDSLAVVVANYNVRTTVLLVVINPDGASTF